MKIWKFTCRENWPKKEKWGKKQKGFLQFMWEKVHETVKIFLDMFMNNLTLCKS